MPTPGAGPFNHAGMLLVASGKGFYFGYGVPQTSAPIPPSGVTVVPVSDADATIEVRMVTRRNERQPSSTDFVACARVALVPAPSPCVAARDAEPVAGAGAGAAEPEAGRLTIRGRRP